MTEKTRTFIYWSILAVALICAPFFAYRLYQVTQEPTDYLEAGLTAYDTGDFEKAVTYFSVGDQLDNPEASFSLGALYMTGRGVEQDIGRAIELYMKAADAGYRPAQVTLAFLFSDGSIIQPSENLALHYAMEAAEANDVEAQILLASWYENGTFGPKDINEAVKWYQKAAKNGDMNAKTALAVIYHNGAKGIKKNIYTAKRWYDSLEKQKRYEKIFLNEPLPPKQENIYKTPIDLSRDFM